MSTFEFSNKDSFNNYFENKITTFIDSGTEGSCFLGKDGNVYKRFFDGEGKKYSIEDIITEDDLFCQCFYFPKTLFKVDDVMVGYNCRAALNNLFKSPATFNKNVLLSNPKVNEIDFKALLEAYYQISEEVSLLTDSKIKIDDLSFNLVFDGKKLIGVDTCSYTRDDSVTLEENQSNLDLAIRMAFMFIIYNKKDQDLECNLDTPTFINSLEKKFVKRKSFWFRKN